MGQSLYPPISPLGTSFHSYQICPFGEKLKMQLGECCGNPAIVNNDTNTQHELFIATNLLNPKPLPGIPSWFLQSDDAARRSLFSSLGIREETEAPKWSVSYQETLDSWVTQFYLEITPLRQEESPAHHFPLQAVPFLSGCSSVATQS